MDISSTFTCRTCPAIVVLESAFLPYSEHSLSVEGAGGILKERKGLSSWLQWALVCFSLLTRCGLLGVQVHCVRGHLEYRVVLSSSHMPREALPRQPRKPGPHPVTTLLWPSCQGYCMFQALHPWQLPNSVHLPPQPYLCPGLFFPKPSRHGQRVCTAVPQFHVSAHQPWLFSPEGRFSWSSMPCVDIIHSRPCAHRALQLFWCTCPTALAHLCPGGLSPGILPMWKLCALGLVPVGCVPTLACVLEGCFLPGNCEPALAWANQWTCPPPSRLPWGLNPSLGGGGPMVCPQPSGTLLEFSLHLYSSPLII